MLAIKRFILLLPLGLLAGRCMCQCTVQNGPPPSKQTFVTGSFGISGTLPGDAKDEHWMISMDSIKGPYSPAIVMSTIPDVYYPGNGGEKWIANNSGGTHFHDRDIFFKVDFDLPCNNPCGLPFTGKNAFTLNLNIYADNSVYEIYVNGKPQSGNLNGIIPVRTPYNWAGSAVGGNIQVKLSKDWQPGPNTLIIWVASSAPVTGLLVDATIDPTPPISDTITKSICEGSSYVFGTQTINKAGTYYQAIHHPGGCDSNTTLILKVLPQAVTVDTSICEGSSYAGYTKSGTYTDKFKSSLGCDSTRLLHLTVYSQPDPHLERDSILCTGDSLVISPGTFLSYLWQDGSTLDHYVVKQPGLYTVTVTSACGSVKSAVYVNEVSCTYIVFPTAFTPNGDGNNDYFKILTHAPLHDFKLTVFNRFGQKVFESTDPAKGWDGTFNGHTQPMGTYVWFCTYKRNGSTFNNKGTVLLLR